MLTVEIFITEVLFIRWIDTHSREIFITEHYVACDVGERSLLKLVVAQHEEDDHTKNKNTQETRGSFMSFGSAYVPEAELRRLCLYVEFFSSRLGLQEVGGIIYAPGFTPRFHFGFWDTALSFYLAIYEPYC